MHLIEPYLAAYGALALFVIIYLESMGAPVPGETVLIASSTLAAQGEINLGYALLAVFAGAVLGDSTGYAIGRFGGHRLLQRHGSRLGLPPARLDKLEDLFRRRGIYVVMTARFVVVLRQLNGLIAGSVRMPWLSFLPANMVGAALWTLTWGLGPYLIVRVVRPLIEHWKSGQPFGMPGWTWLNSLAGIAT